MFKPEGLLESSEKLKVPEIRALDRMLADTRRPILELWNEMLTYGHINGRNHPVVSASARDMLDRPPNEAGSVLSTAKTDDPQGCTSVAGVAGMLVRAVNLHRASLQGLRPVRTTDQAIQRDHRGGVSCPGRASWPALDDHMRADVKIGAFKHTRDCTTVASEAI